MWSKGHRLPPLKTDEYVWMASPFNTLEAFRSYDFNLEILLNFNTPVLNSPYIQITTYSHEMHEENISLFTFSK